MAGAQTGKRLGDWTKQWPYLWSAGLVFIYQWANQVHSYPFDDWNAVTVSTSIVFLWPLVTRRVAKSLFLCISILKKRECQTFFWLAVSYCGTKWSKEACNLQEGCFYALRAVNSSADWRSADIFETCVIQAWTHWPSPSPQVSCISAARFLDCLAFGRRVQTFQTFQVI